MSTLKAKLAKGMGLLALTASLGLASNASAADFNEFQVNPALGGGTESIFTADKITGNYVESIIFNMDGTFEVRLRWIAGQFVAQGGEGPLDAADTGLGNSYRLYALYEGQGTFSTDANNVTTFTTLAGVGDFGLYLDVNRDTNFGANTYATIFDVGNEGDDLLLASGTPGPGGGTLDPTLSTCIGGINCGSFGTSVTFQLTAAGSQFFIDPIPFYNLSFQSGQLNNFTPTQEVRINGSLDVVFDSRIPEPGTLALLGLAFAGLGIATRRKSKAEALA